MSGKRLELPARKPQCHAFLADAAREADAVRALRLDEDRTARRAEHVRAWTVVLGENAAQGKHEDIRGLLLELAALPRAAAHEVPNANQLALEEGAPRGVRSGLGHPDSVGGRFA